MAPTCGFEGPLSIQWKGMNVEQLSSMVRNPDWRRHSQSNVQLNAKQRCESRFWPNLLFSIVDCQLARLTLTTRCFTLKTCFQVCETEPLNP